MREDRQTERARVLTKAKLQNESKKTVYKETQNSVFITPDRKKESREQTDGTNAGNRQAERGEVRERSSETESQSAS